MDLTEYTTFPEIRALLGVSEDEIEDAVIGLEVYSTSLEAELRDVGLTLPTSYQVVRAKATKTDAEDWFFKITRQFAAHVVARKLCTSLPLFSPREISDGKASMSRYADSPYRDTIKRIEADLETSRLRVKAALDTVNSTSGVTVRQTFFLRTQSVDPVTGA